jgi:uncharacterized protein YkwD
MKHLILAVFLILGGAGFAQACDLSPETRASTIDRYVSAGRVCLDDPPAEFRFDPRAEARFVDLINAARQAEGLPGLKVREGLLPAARYHSLDMSVNRFFDHRGPDDRAAVNRIAAFDRTLLAQSTAENIAAFGPTRCRDHRDREVSCFGLPGFTPPTRSYMVEHLHEKLLQSPGHRANILAPESTHVAIGVVRSGTRLHVTQLFTNRVGELSQPLPTLLHEDSVLSLDPEIQNWGFGGLSLVSPTWQRFELEDQSLENVPAGEFSMIVRGKTEREVRRDGKDFIVTQRLDLSGPSVSIGAAREN